MNFRQLRYFLCVAEHLNFSKAARELFIAQPALSQQIAELEKSLDTQLFVRTSRAVSLTPAGEHLLVEGKKILVLVERTTEEVRQKGQGKNGYLQIGYIAAPMRSYLPAFLAHLRECDPSITPHTVQHSVGSLHEALLDDAVDVGITMSFDMVLDDGLQWEVLHSVPESYSLVMHKDHPLSQKPLDMSALSKEPFVVFSEKKSPRYFIKFFQLCNNRGFQPNIVDQKDYAEEVLMTVDAGMGITIITSSARTYDMPNLVFREIEGDDAKVDIIVAWKRATRTKPCTASWANCGNGSSSNPCRCRCQSKTVIDSMHDVIDISHFPILRALGIIKSINNSNPPFRAYILVIMHVVDFYFMLFGKDTQRPHCQEWCCRE